MAYEIRTIRNDESYDAWRSAIATTFVFDLRPEDREFFADINEWDRVIGAYDGEEIVGTGANLTFTMPLPGGEIVPVGGVTAITTLPTHRRRGVLRTMMLWLLEDSRKRGEVISALWSSESSIYGRFGYGNAAWRVDGSLETAHASLREDVETDGTIRLVSSETAEAVIPELYATATAAVPGAIRRSERDWKVYFRDPEHWRDGSSSYRHVIAYRGDEAVGYATYRQKQKWEDSHPKGETMVVDVKGIDGPATAALWRYLFSLDLTTKAALHRLGLDDPLLSMLEQPRRLRMTVDDGLWLRILDVEEALRARRYSADGRLVLGVIDQMFDDVGGTFALNVTGGAGDVTRTSEAADIQLGIEELGELVLGRGGATALAFSGRLSGAEPAVNLLDRMFWWHIPPSCGVEF